MLMVAPVLALAAPVIAAPGRMPSIGPAKTAWFDQSYPTSSPTPPTLPAGVTTDDLYVAGATLPLAVLPVPVPATAGTVRGTLALAAMSFTIPGGTTPASLSLVLTSTPSSAAVGAKAPTGVTLEACPTTSSFQAGGHQPFDRAPSYDCSGRTSLSSLSSDSKSVVFSDIARVARGRLLSFVIRPSTTGVDRLVFAKPTSTALSLLDFDAAPAFTSRGDVPVPSLAPVVTAPTELANFPNHPIVALPPAGAKLPTDLPTALASLAPHVVEAPAKREVLLTAASPATEDTRTRVLALAGLALLLAAGCFLAFTDKDDLSEQKEWGFGRYRGVRDGRAPML
jgi:hypothetical protein